MDVRSLAWPASLRRSRFILRACSRLWDVAGNLTLTALGCVVFFKCCVYEPTFAPALAVEQPATVAAAAKSEPAPPRPPLLLHSLHMSKAVHEKLFETAALRPAPPEAAPRPVASPPEVAAALAPRPKPPRPPPLPPNPKTVALPASKPTLASPPAAPEPAAAAKQPAPLAPAHEPRAAPVVPAPTATAAPRPAPAPPAAPPPAAPAPVAPAPATPAPAAPAPAAPAPAAPAPAAPAPVAPPPPAAPLPRLAPPPSPRPPAPAVSASAAPSDPPAASAPVQPAPRANPITAAINKIEREKPRAKPQVRAKRPTPMTPEEATTCLATAWEIVTGEVATSELVSVLWAQWALETGRGRWMMDFNYAGLKGSAPDGGLSHWWTWEETTGGARRVRSRFRSYVTAQQGANDYVETLVRRYPRAAAAAKRGDAVAFVLELDQGGFFTERPKHYVRSVASLAAEFRRKRREGKL